MNIQMCQMAQMGYNLGPSQATTFYPVFNPAVGSKMTAMGAIPMVAPTFQKAPNLYSHSYSIPPMMPAKSQNNLIKPPFMDRNNNADEHCMQSERGYLDSKQSKASSSSSEGALNSNLIVNYIPSEMTEVELGHMFMAFGDLDSVKLVRDLNTRNSLGYGFVKFINAEEAERAVKCMNGLRIGNKEIKVSFARPSCSDIRDANLYVSNLPNYIVTTKDLEALFSPYGPIVCSRLLLDSNFRPRGVGFVRFNLKQDANYAIACLNGTILENSSAPILVKFAKSNVNYGTLHFAAPPMTPRNAPIRDCVLYVNNLSPELEENALNAMFSIFGRVVDISIIRNHWNKRKNYAFVTMQNHEAARIACQKLNGHQLGSKRIFVSFKLAK